MNYQFWPEISFCLNEVEKEKLQLTKNTMNLDALTAARERINNQLERLRVSLEQSLDKSFASFILFAIVAYLDEDIQAYVLELGQGNWLPLQKDFYGAYNAGELFYETIDKLLDNPDTPPTVMMVFYFILKKGFQGKYRDSKTHITKYQDILKEKISVISPTQMEEHSVYNSSKKNKKLKKWHYYALAGTASVCLLLMLYITSSSG